MGHSSRLRLQDVRAAFRLIGECRDLGDDAEAWRRHAFQGLGPLLGARAAKGGEIHWPRPDGLIRFIRPVIVGFSPEELAVFAPFMRQRAAKLEPIFAGLGGLTGGLVTQVRRQLIDDTA